MYWLFYNFTVDSLLNIPSYVYFGLMVVFFILGSYFEVAFIRKLTWNYFDSKQYKRLFSSGRPAINYIALFKDDNYQGFLWKSTIEIFPRSRSFFRRMIYL